MTRYLVLTKYDEGLDAPPMAEWAARAGAG